MADYRDDDDDDDAVANKQWVSSFISWLRPIFLQGTPPPPAPQAPMHAVERCVHSD